MTSDHIRFSPWTGLLPGLLLGCALSWPLLAGNEQGQVNLLMVLALLVGLPVLTLIFTLLALLRGHAWIPPAWWQHLPFLPASWKAELHRRRLRGESFWWLLHAGQWMVLGFSLGTLLALWLLLLFTDLHFVWRSTLLDARDVLPVLQALAWPWRFWPDAQPTLELLLQTRDNRLLSSAVQHPFDQWWPFVLAAQIFYVLLPRLSLALLATYRLRKSQPAVEVPRVRPENETPQREEPVQQWPTESPWLDAAFLPEEIARQLPVQPGNLQDWPSGANPVIVVRAWEPPLAELSDQLQGRQGLLLPLDWEEGRIRSPQPKHLDEWRRFTAQLPGWKLLLWPKL